MAEYIMTIELPPDESDSKVVSGSNANERATKPSRSDEGADAGHGAEAPLVGHGAPHVGGGEEGAEPGDQSVHRRATGVHYKDHAGVDADRHGGFGLRAGDRSGYDSE